MKKKNFIAKELFSRKYKPRVIKPKKGKGSFKRKKNKLVYLLNFLKTVSGKFPLETLAVSSP